MLWWGNCISVFGHSFSGDWEIGYFLSIGMFVVAAKEEEEEVVVVVLRWLPVMQRLGFLCVQMVKRKSLLVVHFVGKEYYGYKRA